MSRFYTINEVVDEAFRLIDKHELIRNPVIFNKIGSPIRITEYRNDDGFDGNQTGLTLGIYPYSYGSSDLSTTTPNAAIIFKPHQMGDKFNREARDEGTYNLEVKLSTMAMSRAQSQYRTGVKMTRNEPEEALQKWLEIIRVILLSKPLADVGGFVRNSRVLRGAFNTTEWDGESGKNAVLHNATLLWQLDFWPMRDISALPFNRVEGITEGWTFIGVRQSDGMDIYWDADRLDIMTLSGYPLRVTPVDVPVKWNPDLKRFEHRLTGAALTQQQLQDPDAPAGKPWIDTDLRIVGIITVPATETDPAWRYHVYLKPSASTLVKGDGTAVTALPDGSPLAWDGVTSRLRVTPVSDRSLEQLIDLTDPNRVRVNVNNPVDRRRQERIYVP